MRLFGEKGLKWWQIVENCNDSTHFVYQLPQMNSCENSLTLNLFNEKKFPSMLKGFAVKGVIGMYITIIVVFSRLIRHSLINFSTVNVIVEEIPNVDKILNLIQDIYLVREAGEFSLEEDLVAKLFFLYRSPETLIRYTKPHEN